MMMFHLRLSLLFPLVGADYPCNLSASGLRDWLLELSNPTLLRRHANALYENGVDGAALCHAPTEWLAEQFKPPRVALPPSHLLPSSTHECSNEVLSAVSRATALFPSEPRTSVQLLGQAVLADDLCCAPYREFSRLFLGSNSPFINLKSTVAKAEVRAAVSALWAGGSSSMGAQWRDLAGYALAHTLEYGGNATAAAAVFRDLVPQSPLEKGSLQEPSQPSAPGPGSGPATATRPLLMATVASEMRPELEYLQYSAKVANIDLTVLGLGQR